MRLLHSVSTESLNEAQTRELKMWPGTLKFPDLHPARGSIMVEDGKAEWLYSCTSGENRTPKEMKVEMHMDMK